jgi:hypothetical protein
LPGIGNVREEIGNAMEQERKELYSEKVNTRNRTYYLDVKAGRDGARYLVICEAKKTSEGHERARVMVFEENIEAFAEAFDKVVAFMKKVEA